LPEENNGFSQKRRNDELHVKMGCNFPNYIIEKEVKILNYPHLVLQPKGDAIYQRRESDFPKD